MAPDRPTGGAGYLRPVAELLGDRERGGVLLGGELRVAEVQCHLAAHVECAAFADMASFPEAREAMALTRDATAQNGEIIDER